MRRTLITTLSLASLLTACAIPEKMPASNQVVSAEQLGLHENERSFNPQDAWWELYNNTELNKLATQALQKNPTLDEAIARVHQARSVLGLESGSLKPQVAVDANSERDHFSEYYIYPPPYGGSVFWNSTATLGASWSPDLFSLQRSRVHAAERSAVAAEYQYRSAKTLIMLSVVVQAFELQHVQHSIQYTQQSIDVLTQKLNLEHERHEAGLVSSSALIALDTSIKEWQDRLHGLENAEAKIKTALAITVGSNPASAPQYRFELSDPLLKELPEYMPGDLLIRRADVKAALARVQSGQYSRLAAQAAFYPNINLSAFAGYQSLSIKDFITAPARTLGSGLDVSLPLLDGGRLNAQAKLTHYQLDAFIAEYNGVVLNAIKDVVDGIADVKRYHQQVESKTAQLTDASQLLEQNERRFNQGLQNRLVLLDAQLACIHAAWELDSAQTTLAQQKASLLVALGGPPEPVLTSHPEVVP